MIFKKKRNVKVGTNKINLGRFIVATIICIIALILLILSGTKIIKAITFSKKDQLTIYLEDMGKDFYETFYYEQLGTTSKEREDFLNQYKDIGIKVSLETLSRYQGSKNIKIAEKFVDAKTKKACDRDSTKVIIYPKSPYKRDTYKLETVLDCK